MLERQAVLRVAAERFSLGEEMQDARGDGASRETNEALDLVSECFRLLSENCAGDVIHQDELQSGLRVLLLRLKVDRDHIGEIDIRAVRPIFRLDKTYFLHGKSPLT